MALEKFLQAEREKFMVVILCRIHTSVLCHGIDLDALIPLPMRSAKGIKRTESSPFSGADSLLLFHTHPGSSV